jgi:hypothetical protein
LTLMAVPLGVGTTVNANLFHTTKLAGMRNA